MASELTFHHTIHVSNLSVELCLEFNLINEVEQLTYLSIDKISSTEKFTSIPNKRPHDSNIKEILSQLENYFLATKAFEITKMSPDGTVFQKSVWNELSKIPLGETCTYGDIAKKLHTSPRAVGNACRKNPIQVIVPCHRVVSAAGVGGYAGETKGKQIDIKNWLLNHESIAL